MTHASRKTQLEISEGVLLGHALVARLANSLGIRVFFIKGPGSVLQGLRRPRTSTDVDVFVAPSSLEPLLQALRERGWQERPSDADTKTFPQHSVTVHHPNWPCCVDIHYRFPGMENSASDCFDLMWADTDVLTLAGQVVRIPTEPLAILILALHALRTPHLSGSKEELDFLSRKHGRAAASELLRLAAATGSLAAIRPFLEDFIPGGNEAMWPEPSREWQNRLMAREPGSARLIAIVQAPWQEKLQMLLRAVWPPAEVFLSQDAYADMSFLGTLWQHWKRWAYFLRMLPRVARDMREFQRSRER